MLFKVSLIPANPKEDFDLKKENLVASFKSLMLNQDVEDLLQLQRFDVTGHEHDNVTKDKDFIAKLPNFMLESLKKGNNPTQRILSILKQIEKEFPEQKSNISIKNIKTPARLNKQSRINSFFYVENTTEQKRLPMSLLLKDPAANLFI